MESKYLLALLTMNEDAYKHALVSLSVLVKKARKHLGGRHRLTAKYETLLLRVDWHLKMASWATFEEATMHRDLEPPLWPSMSVVSSLSNVMISWHAKYNYDWKLRKVRSVEIMTQRHFIFEQQRPNSPEQVVRMPSSPLGELESTPSYRSSRSRSVPSKVARPTDDLHQMPERTAVTSRRHHCPSFVYHERGRPQTRFEPQPSRDLFYEWMGLTKSDFCLTVRVVVRSVSTKDQIINTSRTVVTHW